MRFKMIFLFTICVYLMLPVIDSFSQFKEEKEEKAISEPVISDSLLSYRLNMHTAIFSGYDSNVYQDKAKKGDSFQEFLYTLRFKKHLTKDSEFILRYFLDSLNYGEVTDASNVLNKLVFEFSQDVFFFKIATGYDFAYLYYPHYEEGDFMFHKGFFYIADNITSKLYHRLKIYYGIKDYLEGKALGETSGTYQSKDRLDRREYVEYSLRYRYSKDLTFRLKGSYSLNNSNARYQDYYDYNSPGVSWSMDYRLKPKLYCLLDYSYRRKNYKGRNVTSQSYKQEDNLHAVGLTFIYFLNKKSSLSLKYIFRETSSNDSLSEYGENVISLGWRYYF